MRKPDIGANETLLSKSRFQMSKGLLYSCTESSPLSVSPISTYRPLDRVMNVFHLTFSVRTLACDVLSLCYT